ncbi:MAG: DUF3108 domain-containing protein [Planctomycetes bacterium]|nr:DUF3108 domain-containing protein [Planctomycetota bacterium]
MIRAALVLALTPTTQGSPVPPSPALSQGPPAAQSGPAPAPPEFIRIERGAGHVPLLLPRDEELVFDVIIDVGILGDIDVGDVTLSSGVERTPLGLPSAREAERKVELFDRAWVKSVAKGGYAGYEITHTLTASHMPLDWPRVLYKDVQRGSENRERELKLGILAGTFMAEYRSDGHCGGCSEKAHFVDSIWAWGKPYHCKKCKLAEHRVWRDPKRREVDQNALDMLSAVYAARAMVDLDVKSTAFTIVDRQRVWRVKIERGETRRQSVPAGRFECVQMKLSADLAGGEGEPEGSPSHFQGLFGIQGAIQIWFDARSGVPVLIQGELPIPVPLVGNLDLSVVLKRYRGTPPDFAPAR